MSRQRGVNSRDGTTVPFHQLVTATFTSGAYANLFNPTNLSSRVLQEADAWAHFRLLHLKMRLHPSSRTSNQVLGWVGGVQDTPPATPTAIAELIPSAIMASGATVPTEWISVPQADCRGPFPWYKSLLGTADPTEESPGAIVIAGTGSEAFTLELRGALEFKTAVSPVNTPAAARLREELRFAHLSVLRERARLRLLSSLSPTVPSQALSTTPPPK